MNVATFILLIASLLAASAVASETLFSYADQRAWPTFPRSQCGGRRQSPIALDFRSSVPNPLLGRQLACSWQNSNAIIAGSLINNGRTIELEVRTPHHCRGLPGHAINAEFRLAKVHIHLGLSNNIGSEHRINGRFGALEIHLVHFDTRFRTFELAQRQPNGLMVTAIVFDHVNEGLANCELSKLALVTGGQLRRVRAEAEFALLARNLIAGTGLELSNELFFTYRGSLTTPTCDEVVTWIVAAGRGRVGGNTLALLRSAQGLDESGRRIAPNFRSLQKLNDRQVLTSFVF